ncbi:MAG TPA: APC family permease, partial [Anaerolineae bacterium]|nr:APC family permease [Anaerolineae bacterium]
MKAFRPARRHDTKADAPRNGRVSEDGASQEETQQPPLNAANPITPRNESAGVTINPELTSTEIKKGMRLGDTYVRRLDTHSRFFKRVAPGHFVATAEATRPQSALERMYRRLKAMVIGAPIESAHEIHERLTKVKALAVFSSDAISSVAYATGEIMIVLALAGSQALGLSVPISFAIALLLFIVAFSYRQTVLAYPNGGGSYIVSRENIGTRAGLIAAAALLIDYILTVAVSISAGTDAVTSAFPILRPYTVEIALFFVGMMTLLNLRGIRESGSVFAIPTYAFILSLGALIILGLGGILLGMLNAPADTAVIAPVQPLDPWLILTAFSAGAVAMSGVEAISN